MLFIIVALTFLVFHDRKYYAKELEISRSIELANWQKLNQLESRINGQNKTISRIRQELVDMAEEQVCTPVPSDSEF